VCERTIGSVLGGLRFSKLEDPGSEHTQIFANEDRHALWGGKAGVFKKGVWVRSKGRTHWLSIWIPLSADALPAVRPDVDPVGE